jgi:hypothetical protein
VPTSVTDHAMPHWSNRKESAQVVRFGYEPRRAATILESRAATAMPAPALMPQRTSVSGEATKVMPRPTGGERSALANENVQVVNVTIGRVEVRALNPAGLAARQRNSSAAPHPLSLDEYLKQRGGGR